MGESPRDRERRRAHVFRLLKDGTGDKMMVNRSAQAAEKLRRAYVLARDPVPIFSPLYEVAAYRLANVLFRSARTAEQLREVDRLYVEATGDVGHRLGPMPLIHRVAVLHRLAMLAGISGAERARLQLEMERVYVEACQLARARSFGELPGRAGGAHIQGSLHNLLELTAYYNDFDYEERISGLVSPFEDLQLGEDWMIVGTDGVSDSVRMPREFAAAELEARAAEGADLLFELGEPRPRARFRAWKPGGREVKVGGRELLSLAQLCRGPSTDEQLYAAVYGEEPMNDGRLRDVKRDLREFLGNLLGERGTELIPEVGTGEYLKLRPGIRIYGMAAVSSLRAGR